MQTVLTVFFSGTDFEITQPQHLTSLFFKHTLISNQSNNPRQEKMGFSGCGKVYGLMGQIFGYGMDSQAQQVIQRVQFLRQQGQAVKLNLVGVSRGAISAAMVAKQLSGVADDDLEINLAFHDPVAGNSALAVFLDPFEISLTNKTIDLRHCKSLKNVLALYPHGSLLYHAPSLFLYPPTTKVQQEVICGTHMNAQTYSENNNLISFKAGSYISFCHMYDFLTSCGTALTDFPQLRVEHACHDDYIFIKSNKLTRPFSIAERQTELLKVYQNQLQYSFRPATRDCHSPAGLKIYTQSQAAYFNEHHYRLEQPLADVVALNPNELLLSLRPSNSPLSWINRQALNYPNTTGFLKWFALGLILTTVLVLTGGVSVLFTPGVIGGLEAIVNTAIISTLLAATIGVVWNKVLQPFGTWVASRFIYPAFENIQLAAKEVGPGGSSYGGPLKKVLNNRTETNDSTDTPGAQATTSQHDRITQEKINESTCVDEDKKSLLSGSSPT